MARSGNAGPIARSGNAGRHGATRRQPGWRMSTQLFNVVYGRDLAAKLPEVLSEPYLVVTMADLWPPFEPSFTPGRRHVHLVDSLEVKDLEVLVRDLPAAEVVVGLGGGP